METPISSTATIVSVLGPRTFRIRLRNGKESIGHLAEDLPVPEPAPAAGDQVALELTPYDFDHARIVGMIRPV